MDVAARTTRRAAARRWPPLVGALLACLLAPVAAAAPAAPAGAAPAEAAPAVAAAPARPNVLVVNLDDARAEALRWMPKTARWLADGRRFANARVAIPSCCPSRAAMFTGRYPHNTGVERQEAAAALDFSTTFAAQLRASGYRTAMAGKFLVSWPTTSPPPGWERHSVIWEGYYGFEASVQGVPRTLPATVYSTNWLGRQLRASLTAFEATDARPWLAYLAPQAPHTLTGNGNIAEPEHRYATAPTGPCGSPGEADKRDKPQFVRQSLALVTPDFIRRLCQSQARTLRSVDDQVDLVLRQLRDAGELADTLVVLTSDNGYLWGEHGHHSKFLPYEPSLRVPLVLRWPGHVDAGVDRRLVSNVDIAPTVLEAAGVAPRAVVDGRSLLAPGARTHVFAEYTADSWNGPMPTFAVLATHTWKYIETRYVDREGRRVLWPEYYDLVRDPGELTNILRDDSTANDLSAERLRQLRAQLAAARTCAGASCP